MSEEGTELAAAASDGVSRRRMVIGIVGTLLVLVVVFGVILPQIIDYDEVVEAFRSMEAWQHAVLVGLMIGTWLILGITLAHSLDGLAVVRATQWMVGSLAIKGTIPGPMDAAFRFRIAAAYGHPVDVAAISAATLKSYDWIARLLMPIIAVVILVLGGEAFAGLGWLAIIALAVSVGGLILLIGLIRSEPLARRLGLWAQRVTDGAASRLGRPAPTGVADQAIAVRNIALSLVSREGFIGLALTLLLQAVYAVMLTLAMDFVGVDFDVLPVAVIWAALAFVYLLPIGPGLIELAYIAIFALYLGDNEVQLAAAGAAVMVFRIYQWLLPVPLGFGLIVWWQRRDRFSLLSMDSAQAA